MRHTWWRGELQKRPPSIVLYITDKLTKIPIKDQEQIIVTSTSDALNSIVATHVSLFYCEESSRSISGKEAQRMTEKSLGKCITKPFIDRGTKMKRDRSVGTDDSEKLDQIWKVLIHQTD